jgi:hypothetical protein
VTKLEELWLSRGGGDRALVRIATSAGVDKKMAARTVGILHSILLNHRDSPSGPMSVLLNKLVMEHQGYYSAVTAASYVAIYGDPMMRQLVENYRAWGYGPRTKQVSIQLAEYLQNNYGDEGSAERTSTAVIQLVASGNHADVAQFVQLIDAQVASVTVGLTINHGKPTWSSGYKPPTSWEAALARLRAQ